MSQTEIYELCGLGRFTFLKDEGRNDNINGNKAKIYSNINHAGVAELADALDLGNEKGIFSKMALGNGFSITR